MLLQNTCWSAGLFCFTSFFQSINNDPINRLNHLINNDMKLTADQPAKGSVNKCTGAAPSVTSSLLKLSISQYCISPVRLRITSVSSMFYPVNGLSEGKHVQEECQNHVETPSTLLRKTHVKTLGVWVLLGIFFHYIILNSKTIIVPYTSLQTSSMPNNTSGKKHFKWNVFHILSKF